MSGGPNEVKETKKGQCSAFGLNALFVN